jgi:hypothetical protein
MNAKAFFYEKIGLLRALMGAHRGLVVRAMMKPFVYGSSLPRGTN